MMKTKFKDTEVVPTQDKVKLTGFGASSAFGAHIFKAHVPPGRAGDVILVEDYGFLGGQNGTPEKETRAVLPRAKWTPIAEATRKDFNARLRARKVPPGSWKPADNLLDRMLGKELCVLMWACEHASDAQVDLICDNWLALRPEERWWLYSMTAAQGNLSTDGHRGWRRALYSALSDGGSMSPKSTQPIRLLPTQEMQFSFTDM